MASMSTYICWVIRTGMHQETLSPAVFMVLKAVVVRLLALYGSENDALWGPQGVRWGNVVKLDETQRKLPLARSSNFSTSACV